MPSCQVGRKYSERGWLTGSGCGNIFVLLMDISIVIPAYNEEKRIALTLEKSVEFLQQRSWECELLVVDDGSSDRTVDQVREFAQQQPLARCLQNERNRGKGYSIRHGVQQARGQYIGFMDADYKTDISALDQVVPRLEEGYDGVIGDRSLGQTHIAVARRRYRQFGSDLFKRLLRTLMGLEEFGDTQCGFKFFQADILRDLFARQRVDGYMFDVESLYLAKKFGYTIKEFPVKWENDPSSKLRIIYDTARMFKHLAQIRFGSYPTLPKNS